MTVNIGTGLITPEQRELLKKARDTYGSRTQVTIAAEECSELTKELLKYLRFEEPETAVKKTRKSVISETADVLIIMDHIFNIFEISSWELIDQIDLKLKRLKKWLDNSNSIEYTTKDRSLDDETEGMIHENQRI